METPVLSPQAIRVLTVLSDEGSFTLAADRLGITQSAVSRTVRQLEDALGVVLFARGRAGAAPTPALAAVLPRLRRIQRELHGATEALVEAERRPSGSLRIVGFRSAVTALLPSAVSAFMNDYSDVRVSLAAVREDALGVQHVVEQGQADFGVTSFEPPARLRSTYLGSDRYVVVRRRETSAFSPASGQLVLWKERCSQLIPDIVKFEGWSVSTRMEVDTDLAVIAMIAHGGGFSIMPELAVEPLPANVEKVPLSGNFRRGIWLCGLPAAWESTAGRAVRRYIRKATRLVLENAPPTEMTGRPRATFEPPRTL